MIATSGGLNQQRTGVGSVVYLFAWILLYPLSNKNAALLDDSCETGTHLSVFIQSYLCTIIYWD